MSTSKYCKLSPKKIGIDARWQRDLDEQRARRMAKSINMNRLGVPVVSLRPDGSMVALDGQHRIAALQYADFDGQIMCDVQEGLSLADEAELYLLLNSDRKAVQAFDKFKARLIARDAVAIEIKKIVSDAGLRITKAQGPNCVCAIKALESVHMRHGNLADVLSVLVKWSDGDPSVYEGSLIKDLSYFLAQHPDVELRRLGERLSTYSPERIMSKIKRTQGTQDDVPRSEAACKVFRDIYNYRAKGKARVSRAA